jgi:hypothetical protein
MSKKYLTAEELLELEKTKELLENYSDEYGIKHKIKFDLAQTKHYEINVFYHATGGTGETGVGHGLYLGKDRRALNNFYNGDGTRGQIIKYRVRAKFIDLTRFDEFEAFEAVAISKFPKREHNEQFKLLALELGFDGIRYYDPIATGEEFVLYNTEKAKMLTKPKEEVTL